jgi:hypothetical protein
MLGDRQRTRTHSARAAADLLLAMPALTRKRPLVRTQYRPPHGWPVRPACTSRFGHGSAAGCEYDERGSVGGRRSAPDVNQLCRAWDEALVMREFRIVVTRGPSGSGRARPLRAMCTQSDLLAGTNLGHEWQSDGRIGDGFHLHTARPAFHGSASRGSKENTGAPGALGGALTQPVRVPARRSTDRRFAWPNV